MKKLTIQVPSETLHETRVDDAVNSGCSGENLGVAMKPQRRIASPQTWPKIPEGAAGTAAAFGAWKTVTHSGRKI